MLLNNTSSLKRYRNPGLWMLGLLLLLLTGACNPGFTEVPETRDDSFAVGNAPRIVVNDANGRIIVRPGSDGAVRVLATLREPGRLAYEISQEGDTITVQAKRKSRGIFNFGNSAGADIEITEATDRWGEIHRTY